MKKYFTLPHMLLGIYIILFLFLSLSPYERHVWLVENLTVMGVVAALVIFHWKGIRFSNTAYILMSIFIFLHTIGGHYTFERVPFDFVTHLIGLGRNNFDRMAHFTVGFYAFGIAEMLVSKKLVSRYWVAALFGLFAIGAIAAFYEIFEWIFAVTSDPTAGIAVLGSQGDIWDAQKDMLADTLGAIVAIWVFYLSRRKDHFDTHI